jgi:PBP1b-binding outer membrane lipoprotein LpoB
MANIVSKLKTATLIAGAAVLVAACGEKAAETNVEVTTEETAPAMEEAPADAAAMEAAPAEGMEAAPVEGAVEAAPAAEAPAAE